MTRPHPSDQLDAYLDTASQGGRTRGARLEELLARYGPIGRQLGCGHWGCVYELDAPWVLKVTFDPQEGRMWLLLAELAEQDPPVMQGVARVKELMRLRPDEIVMVAEDQHETVPVHAIVREAVMPFRSRGVPSSLTLRVLGDPGAVQMLAEDLKQYQSGALLHASGRPEVLRKASDRMGEAAQKLMAEWSEAAFALGRTLRYLTNRGIALPDLHAGNVGWRIHETIEGRTAPPGLVILDPGHSPTPPELQERIPEFELNRSLRRAHGR